MVLLYSFFPFIRPPVFRYLRIQLPIYPSIPYSRFFYNKLNISKSKSCTCIVACSKLRMQTTGTAFCIYIKLSWYGRWMQFNRIAEYRIKLKKGMIIKMSRISFCYNRWLIKEAMKWIITEVVLCAREPVDRKGLLFYWGKRAHKLLSAGRRK